ncbi:MAG TPA: M1 family aminopeptidase [Thermoanaerobaculia bacterium]|jgi:ABC-type transport system involved in multi-copper enzyme maturation permease subunit
MLLRAIASFELRYHLRAPLFSILFCLYFALTLVSVSSDAVSLGGALGQVHRNSPYVTMAVLVLMGLFAPLTATAFVAASIQRDFELKSDALFFTMPVKKWQYMGGRFLGSFLAALLVYLGVFAAIVFGSFAPWVPREELGPVALYPYLYSLCVLVAPNLLFFAALFFAVAALTRSLMATYASVVATYVLYGVAGSLGGDIGREILAVALLDPFGVLSWMLSVRYWSVFEKNTRVVALEGVLLWNRLLWLGVAAAVLGVAYVAFRSTARSRGGKVQQQQPVAEPLLPPVRPLGERPVETRHAPFAQFLAIVRFELLAILTSVPFLIMLFCGVVSVAGASSDLGGLDAPYPVTREMVDAIWAGFAIFSLLIAAFYSGEVVWRERSAGLSEVSDALPVPAAVLWPAKLTSLLLVVLVTLVAAVLTAVAVQTAMGYTNYEPELYLKAVLGLIGVRLALIAGLAFLLQLFFNHRLAGFIGLLLWFTLHLALPKLGFEHVLYRFASLPPVQYSDMNGYGHFAAPMFWISLYWILFVALMLAVGHLFWVRGTESGLRQRLRIARGRLRKPVAAPIALLFAAFASTGCFIYYNTNVLNTYRTADELEALQAAAEKEYKRYERHPRPGIVEAKANVDLHPERRAVFIDGSYVAVNRSGVPIRDLHVTWSPRTLTSFDAAIPGATLRSDDRELGYRVYTLARPLAPGASLTMKFRTAFEARGFPNGDANNKVVENGTFINSFDYFPHFGYTSRVELQDNNARRRHGLPPVERMKKAHDAQALRENKLGRGTDWVSLNTTVSTSADQIALAPGYLQRQWTANGRRYFHYKTTSPIPGFWAYLSARYQVKRGRWRDVPIEIYYDARHPYNVDRMIEGVQKSLEYFSRNYSPYQHRQVRIVEFPGYADFAQALPNTIPVSETMGFVADLRDGEAIDYVFYVVAHELAHQWWGHQVVGASVQGMTMLHESIAQYSALMVLEKEYPPAKMRRLLRYELDRYLDGRSRETIAELPLVLVEKQDYIHYRKGALAMYALQDAIGEERVNRALARFVREHAFAGPPYPAARQLVEYFRAESPPEQQELISDLFERIVLYDLQAREAAVSRRADGRYVVKLTVAATKLRADGVGKETPVPIDDWADVVVFGENEERTLFAGQRRLTRPVQTFEVVVEGKPSRVGIDPFHKLIDRNPNDNVSPLPEPPPESRPRQPRTAGPASPVRAGRAGGG